MKGKKVFYTELAYLLGIITLAVGTALMERADFGMSMVVAPAYLVHRKLVLLFPWFSFGVAEYCLQAVLLAALALLMGRLKRKYLFSFATAVFYGYVLDLAIFLIGFVPMAGWLGRFAFFVAGLLLCSVGVSLLFHTYISPEAYELFVKEFAQRFGGNINTVKTVYDCVSCLVAIILSFLFFGFGHFEGVKLGTIVCALINGSIIGACSGMLERGFEFRDGLKLRRLFE